MRAEVRTAGWTMTRVGGMLSSLLLLVGVLEAQAQNLVQNPGFTSDLSGWTPISSPSYTVAWDGAFGFNAPGSASFDLPSSLNNMNFYFLHQCVPVAASTAYAVGGNCGIPAGAKAISLNLTATPSSAQGNVALFPAGQPAPVSTINYVAGQTRANNAVVSLDPSGAMAAFVGQPVGTTVHLVIDVNGYFQ